MRREFDFLNRFDHKLGWRGVNGFLVPQDHTVTPYDVVDAAKEF